MIGGEIMEERKTIKISLSTMFLIITIMVIAIMGYCIYTMSNSLRGVFNNKVYILILSVILPFIFSFLGFGFIVANFYPITSIWGIFLLGELFLLPLFKKAYKKIHSSRKETEKHDT